MRVRPLAAFLLLGCSTGSPSASPTESASPADVGTAASALRRLGQNDAQAVERCRTAAERCAARSGDGGLNGICERIADHCDELEAELAEARAALEECLSAAAACEAAATDDAECEDERAACDELTPGFERRRGNTLECSNQAEQCLAPEGADAGDAGAECSVEARDFVGCCRKRNRDGSDAGVDRGRDGRPGFGPFGRRRGGFFAGRDRGGDRDNRGDDADAGAASSP